MSTFFKELADTDFEKTKEVKASFEKNNKNTETFCVIPFSNIILEPDGKVGMCRQKGSEFPIGNIKKNSISQIWNGPKAREWRREFIDGKPKKCKENISHTHCNMCHSNNDFWKYIQIEEVQTSPILKLTANLNGKCNLKCNMCHIWRKPNDIYNEDNFWIPAKRDIFPYIKELEMLSGEPFIQQDTFRLINEVSLVNPDCHWSITTNAHYKLNDYHYKMLDKIKLKNLLISIDSLNPETYSIIRQPGDLKIVLRAIDDFIAYNKTRDSNVGSINIRFNFLIVKENWRELKQMLDFCRIKDIHPFIAFCYRPSENSLLTFDERTRIEILYHYLDNLSWHELIFSMRVIKPLIDSISKIEKISILEKISRLKNNSAAIL